MAAGKDRLALGGSRSEKLMHANGFKVVGIGFLEIRK